MSIPIWTLLGFAAWTLLTLIANVGVYRWSHILTGRASLNEWRADQRQGSERYQRAMRAHQNCIENLSVYTAIIIVLIASETAGTVIDALAITILVARIFHTLIHIGPEQTNLVAGIRFAFFSVQIICMIAMGTIAALNVR